MSFGNVDFTEFRKMAKNIEQATQDEAIDEILAKILMESANRVLAKTKERTPVGQYPAGSGRVGGHLRRNWFLSSLERKGRSVSIEIYNTVHYASFREYGHRTRNGGGQGWVEGSFMLTLALKDIEAMLPEIVQKHQQAFLERLLNL